VIFLIILVLSLPDTSKTETVSEPIFETYTILYWEIGLNAVPAGLPPPAGIFLTNRLVKPSIIEISFES
jgi:hypothetical protein